MKAGDPKTGKVMFFVDKCLLFGASINCSHFQRFSDSLHHIVIYRTAIPKSVMNYLDDFLFLAATLHICNFLVSMFLKLCKEINFPVAFDKTCWGTLQLVFLGVLQDSAHLRLCLPEEKQTNALHMLQKMTQKKKAMIKELQKLTGTLNFLCKVIHPGRTFTRRMYNKICKPTK